MKSLLFICGISMMFTSLVFADGYPKYGLSSDELARINDIERIAVNRVNSFRVENNSKKEKSSALAASSQQSRVASSNNTSDSSSSSTASTTGSRFNNIGNVSQYNTNNLAIQTSQIDTSKVTIPISNVNNVVNSIQPNATNLNINTNNITNPRPRINFGL